MAPLREKHWVFMRHFLLSFFLISSLLAETPQQKKLVLITVPKSGTNLIKKAVEKISGKRVQWTRSNRQSVELLEKELQKSGSPCYITHLFSDDDPIGKLNSEKFTKVLMIRDPRDVMVSFVYHINEKGRWPFSSRYDHKAFKTLPFDAQLTSALQFPSQSPCDSIPVSVKWSKNPEMTVIRFEDLIGVKGGGSDEAQANTIRHLANLMGITLTLEKVREIQDSVFGGTWTFRRGQIGDWKMSYNAQNKELFKSLFGQSTIDLGYTTDLNW